MTALPNANILYLLDGSKLRFDFTAETLLDLDARCAVMVMGPGLGVRSSQRHGVRITSTSGTTLSGAGEGQVIAELAKKKKGPDGAQMAQA